MILICTTFLIKLVQLRDSGFAAEVRRWATEPAAYTRTACAKTRIHCHVVVQTLLWVELLPIVVRVKIKLLAYVVLHGGKGRLIQGKVLVLCAYL